jgi:DNA-binding NarL/FixJ family response regulator
MAKTAGRAILRELGMRPRDLRILVVDDHALMRDAVRSIIDAGEGIEIAGEAETAAEALRLAGSLGPDLVLLDLALPDTEGLRCLEALRRRHPDTLVVVFSGVEDPDLIAGALECGAAAFVLKRTNPHDLAAAIRQAVDQTVFTGRGAPLQGASRARLTRKELEVLAQLALARSNREIAQALWISDQTVKFHLRNVYRKLGASTRTEAVRIAHERALVPSPI